MADFLTLPRPHDGAYGTQASEQFALGFAELAVAGYLIFQDGFQISDIGAITAQFPRAISLATNFSIAKLELGDLSLAEGFYVGHSLLYAVELALQKIVATHPAAKQLAKRTLVGARGIGSTRKFLEAIADLASAGYRVFSDGFQPLSDIPQLIGMFPQGYVLAQELNSTRVELGSITFEDGIDVGHAVLDAIKRTYQNIQTLQATDGASAGVED